MARIFLFIAIALALASSYLGYQTKSHVASVRDERDQATAQVAEKETARAKAATEAKKAKEEATAANDAKKDAEAATATAKADAEKAKTDLQKATSDVTAKETELTDLKKKLADLQTAPPAATGPDPEQAKQVAELQTKLKEVETVEATLEAKSKDAEARAKVLEEDKTRRDQSLQKIGLEGKVLAVNPNWSFVVLSIGDRQGVVMNSVMVIKRGNTMMAKVRISSVEPVTSIADIIPGSTPKGVKGNAVQPGDVVIFAGS